MSSEKRELAQYEWIKQLGKGAFGIVVLARNKQDGRYYAVKRMSKKRIIAGKQVDHILNEVQVLRSVQCPFIVSMHKLFQLPDSINIDLQYVNGQLLFSYLRRRGQLEKQQAVLYAAQVVLAIEHLHARNIVFRDLKPQNILLDQKGYLKLTDFGFAKVVRDRTFTLCGTPEYLAPQIIQNVGHGKPVDWWTLGVFIYQLIAGIDPFADEDTLSIYQNILKCKIKFPKSFDKEAKSIVKHLLVADLSKRYGNTVDGSTAIKNHRFFQSIDWQNIANQTLAMPYIPEIKDPNLEKAADSIIFQDMEPIQPENDPFLIHL